MMKLKKIQRYALLGWLCENVPHFMDISIIYDWDKFCDGKIPEWRVISNFGMAGKLWNNCGRIYISGYSPCELDKKGYAKQQEKIDKWNEAIAELLAIYSI